ncbi:A/G-specific adenine glycosylase [Pontimicrobium aquaticum]|uniref:Adenine DNA glycosylase n=1 Tax=Pontimicrobium aquaticum TaxID=2565367 RepID=A0A4U0F5E2_9FLAO|nr:A/G-specific adenine glycosylase [Pontimicrobium aquaticum]TJY38052.1 A/G-specific adenine glycosylase [Pontimicrobium aquaticum]
MIFNNILTNWYSIHKRDLPWRETKNPYFIWLSEIILQQTQIKQGLPYYETFISKFPTVKDLAEAKESDVLKLWQGLGYYSRARNLHYSAKYISSILNGQFPKNYKELLKLKGVGDYTASAIASICYNESTAVVDGNVYRVLSRYFNIETPINSTKGIKEFKILAQQLLPKSNIGDYNQAIMEFGAMQCKPTNPNCKECPLQDGCKAFALNKISHLPSKLKKTKVSKKHFNFLVFLSNDGKTILEKRTKKGIWQNLYQFPLIESKKSLAINGIKRQLENTSLINIENYSVSLYNEKEIIHKLSHQHLHTKFWIVETESLSKNSIDTADIKTYPVPILIGNFIEQFNF